MSIRIDGLGGAVVSITGVYCNGGRGNVATAHRWPVICYGVVACCPTSRRSSPRKDIALAEHVLNERLESSRRGHIDKVTVCAIERHRAVIDRDPFKSRIRDA